MRDASFQPGQHIKSSPALRQLSASTAIAIAIMAVLPERTAAQSPVDFAGKTITIVVSFPTGGDYDAYARHTANHLGRHLKGNPTVVVQNMPGAGGIVGANFLYNVATKDGTVMGVVPQTAAIAQITGAPNVKYDVSHFNWIGRVNSNVEVQLIWRTALVKTINDVRVHEVVVAGTGPDSSSVVFPNLLNKMFNMKFKVVPGYQGGSMATLAMERGEVAGVALPWSLTKATHADWLKDNKVKPVVQYVVKRHTDLKDVPAVIDLAGDDLQRQILGLYASGAEIGRSIVAPPGTSPPALLALRAGFSATMTDSRFLEDVRKSGLEFDPLAGENLQTVVANVQRTPSDVVAAARRLTRGAD